MENLTALLSREAIVGGSNAYFTPSWALYVLPAALAYSFLAASLRHRRIRTSESNHPYPTKESYASMTDDEAFEMINQMAELEFPTLFEKALQFALFRTYGIPTISSLLTRTSQLSSPSSAGKRYADTGVLVAEIWANKPADERTIAAFARLNYIHGHYIKQGLISNDDMLYTLAQFMCEPVNWINRYEWRQITTLERCASGVFHKSIGDAMQIDYSRLPSGKTGFGDGLQFYDELETWKDAYEAETMVPHVKNHQTANETTKLLLLSLPAWAKGAGFNAVKTVMDDRLRKAMMYDDPPALYPKLVHAVLTLRKYFLRYLALPRPEFARVRQVRDRPDAQGRRTLRLYDNFPYYVKPTLMNRWGPGAWVSWLTGRPLPGDEGFIPEGFLTAKVGPKMFEDKGLQGGDWEREAEQTKERLRRERTGACPFKGKALK